MSTLNMGHTTLIHAIWDSYRKEIPYYTYGEKEIDAEGNLLYIAEETQGGLMEILQRKGFELKHTTKNRRTGHKIFYFVKSEASSPTSPLEGAEHV